MIDNDVVVTAEGTSEKTVDATVKSTVTISATLRTSKDGAEGGRVTKRSGVNKMADFPLWHHFTLTATKTPCYQCERREPGCHGSCEDYQAFSAERQEVYRQRMTYSAATRGRWRKELAKKPR